jgi:hypothetical protein
MSYAFKTIRNNPFLGILATATAIGLGGGFGMLVRSLVSDPTISLRNRERDPYKWVHVNQDHNLKLYSVGNIMCMTLY